MANEWILIYFVGIITSLGIIYVRNAKKEDKMDLVFASFFSLIWFIYWIFELGLFLLDEYYDNIKKLIGWYENGC